MIFEAPAALSIASQIPSKGLPLIGSIFFAGIVAAYGIAILACAFTQY